MPKFIFGTFLVLGLAFYILSGGADFVPEERVVADAAREVIEPTPAPEPEIAVVEEVEETPVVDIQATRADTTALLNLATAELTPTPTELTFTSLATPLSAQETNTAEVETVLASIVEDVAAELPTEETVTAPDADIRFVAGSRVNMRSGPGTTYAVLDTLDGGTAAEVLDVDGNGWARIRLAGTDKIGWMAERLLTIN